MIAFSMQIPDQVECLVVFHMSKVNTGLVHLFAICTIQIYSNLQMQKYIQYSRNSTFTRQNTLFSIILECMPMYTLIFEVHVCIKTISIIAFNTVRVAQSTEHRTTDLRAMGKNFSFCNLSLSTRTWQVDWSHSNEINHDVHSTYMNL